MFLIAAYIGNGAVDFGEMVQGRTLRKSPVDFFSDEPESVLGNFLGGNVLVFMGRKELELIHQLADLEPSHLLV